MGLSRDVNLIFHGSKIPMSLVFKEASLLLPSWLFGLIVFCKVNLGVLARRGWGDKHQPKERNPLSTSHYFLTVAKGVPRKCLETDNMAVGRSGSCCQLPSQLVVLPRPSQSQTLSLKIPLSFSRTKGLAQPRNSGNICWVNHTKLGHNLTRFKGA